MSDTKENAAAEPKRTSEPRGLGEHARGLAGEYAHEQGWGLNEEERSRRAIDKQPYDGGKDYDYGARDFGDTAVDTSEAQPSAHAQEALNPNLTKGD